MAKTHTYVIEVEDSDDVFDYLDTRLLQDALGTCAADFVEARDGGFKVVSRLAEEYSGSTALDRTAS